MFPLLYKYLMLHEQVCVPGVGRFYKQRQPSQLNFAEKVFEPPVYAIGFHEEHVAADKNFFAFLSKEQGIDEVEAVRHFHEFAYDFKDHISRYSYTELPGFGSMKKTPTGEIVFEPVDLLQDYFPSTPAERIVRENIQHNILVGDKERTNTEMQEMLDDDSSRSPKKWWWIAAVVLALLAIAAIAYYYMQHGNLRL